MKYIFAVIITLVSLVITDIAFAQVHVKGYTRKNGTYVQPHMRSNPDGNASNNWSTKGNTNPYTGAAGTHNPDNYGGGYHQPSNSGYNSSYDGYGNSNRNSSSQYDINQ